MTMGDYECFYRKLKFILITNFLLVSFLISKGNAQLGDLEAILAQKTNPEIFLPKNVCYKKIGCFFNGPPWMDPISRPISVQPVDPREKMTLPLFTPSNPQKEYQLNLRPATISSSPYRCELPTIITSHGYMADNKPFLEMKDALLKKGDYNVIVPNMPDYLVAPYFQAVANIRTVGARVGEMMKLLMDHCKYTDAKNFHLIGHSLGAHMSGYAAKHVGQKVGRISGCDVAGPYFQGAPKETRLTPDLADYVDVIHTNAAKSVAEGGFGFWDTVGHNDYWVNNGYTQPGCGPAETLLGGVLELNYTKLFTTVGCSHSRSHDLYTESISSDKCKFSGVQCDSYDSFVGKQCPRSSAKLAEMGFWATKQDVPPGTTYYLETNGDKPYCKAYDTVPEASPNFFSRIASYFLGK